MGKFVRPLPSTPMDDIAHVYGQVAEIVLTLSRLTFPKIGMISGDSNIGSPIVSQCLFHDFSSRNAFSTASELYTARY